MTAARFAITHAGPQVSVQDAGRPGLMRYGVPNSGPMDRTAYRIANQVLANPPGTPAIEVSLGGLTLRCAEGEVDFAVAGGSFQVALNGEALGPWAVSTIRAGQTLMIRPGRWGAWCYLAFSGQLQCHRWLGSAATHGPSGLGGGFLVTGGSVTIDDAGVRSHRYGAMTIPVSSRPRTRLRAVPGPQSRFFGPETIAALFASPFRLTDAYDRMGVRLAGPLLIPNTSLDMPSEPIVRGSIQVAGDGMATVLLADHQTTGGYPKIATIISDDLDGFAQLRSRAVISFDAIRPDAAVSAYRTRQHAQARFITALAKP